MAHNYICRNCGCSLDPNEMPYCDECKENMKRDAEQRKFYGMTVEVQKSVKELLQGA